MGTGDWDRAFGGDGNDVFWWRPGDGNDEVHGGAGADGMVGGEGVAVVMLKRAIDAVRDGDAIYALIRGTAINNDGGEKAGFYAPSIQGQTAVIQKVLDKTGIDPATICSHCASSMRRTLSQNGPVALITTRP